MIAQSHSGTGKTAAFCIGMLQRVDVRRAYLQGLVLSPTRELAEQTADVLGTLGAFLMPDGDDSERRLHGVFVGQTLRTADYEVLRRGVLVAIGTPGRVTDLIKRSAMRVDRLASIVLDEADELLGHDFRIEEIFRFVPRDVQVCLFSATMPPPVLDLCGKFMRNPHTILLPQDAQTLEGIKQFYVAVDDDVKIWALRDLYDSVSIAQSVVFANTRRRVEWITAQLSADHHTVASIHAAMDASERNRVMTEFRRGKSRVLVTTDLVSRGIDVQHVNFVINYDVPLNLECYLHRIGRSGRYGRRGVAINFVSPGETDALREIEQHYAMAIEELPANFATFLESPS